VAREDINIGPLFGLLIAQEPELCYNCNDDYTVSASFIHGPVAVGQCLFCHNPHKSKIEQGELLFPTRASQKS